MHKILHFINYQQIKHYFVTDKFADKMESLKFIYWNSLLSFWSVMRIYLVSYTLLRKEQSKIQVYTANFKVLAVKMTVDDGWRGENWPQFFDTSQLLEKLWSTNCFETSVVRTIFVQYKYRLNWYFVVSPPNWQELISWMSTLKKCVLSRAFVAWSLWPGFRKS